MVAMSDQSPEALLTVTDEARQHISSLREGEDGGDKLGLWVEVSGVEAGAYRYDMWFEELADAAPSDAVVHHDDLAVVVPATSVERLRGATLDLVGDGMVIRNPNAPPAVASASAGAGAGADGVAGADMPQGDLSGEVAQAVLRVLEESVNPGIAAHGGRAELVAVEDGAAFLRLLGGCVGCGLATVTLSQGIEVAIRDAVPDIVRVVDVTDHASGTNPYYEPAKK